MSRVVLYVFCGCNMAPYRKSYRKARYRRKMHRAFPEEHEFIRK